MTRFHSVLRFHFLVPISQILGVTPKSVIIGSMTILRKSTENAGNTIQLLICWKIGGECRKYDTIHYLIFFDRQAIHCDHQFFTFGELCFRRIASTLYFCLTKFFEKKKNKIALLQVFPDIWIWISTTITCKRSFVLNLSVFCPSAGLNVMKQAIKTTSYL